MSDEHPEFELNSEQLQQLRAVDRARDDVRERAIDKALGAFESEQENVRWLFKHSTAQKVLGVAAVLIIVGVVIAASNLGSSTSMKLSNVSGALDGGTVSGPSNYSGSVSSFNQLAYVLRQPQAKEAIDEFSICYTEELSERYGAPRAAASFDWNEGDGSLYAYGYQTEKNGVSHLVVVDGDTCDFIAAR